MKKLRWKATITKWMGNGADLWMTVAIIVALVIMIIAAFSISAHAHELHFTEWSDTRDPIVASGWVHDVGFVLATDADADGVPDHFWLICKRGDLTHVGLHVEPLTYETAHKYLLERRLTE